MTERRGLVALILVGTVARVVYAFATVGVAYDIESLTRVAMDLRGESPGSLYASERWPYPGGFFPIVAVCDLVSRGTGLPFHGVIQLPSIAADAALAALVHWTLRWRGASERAALAGAALVALGPSFAVISGYHGQIDAVAILPALVGVLVWIARVPRRALWAGLLIGLAAAVKQPPLFMVLALLPSALDHRERLVLAATAVAVPVVSVLPFLLAAPAVTLDGLTANRGVAGFGGWSAFVQPDLTRYWYTLEPGVVLSDAMRFVIDAQNMIVGVAVLAAGALAYRRRLEPLGAATLIWLTVFVANPNFAYQYLIWGLPFFLAAGHVRGVAALQAAFLPATVLIYSRPIDDSGWIYFAAVQLAWLGLVVVTARAWRNVLRAT